jgi:hypothetical protein
MAAMGSQVHALAGELAELRTEPASRDGGETSLP